MIRNKRSVMLIPALITTTIHACTWFILGLFTSVFLFLVNVFMPPWGKRWLVLTSLYFTLNPTSEKRALDEIAFFNKQMDLVNDFNALKLAFYLRNRIWPAQVLKECVNEVDTVHGVERDVLLTNSLIDRVIPQMRYGRRSDLERDISAVLRIDASHKASMA